LLKVAGWVGTAGALGLPLMHALAQALPLPPPAPGLNSTNSIQTSICSILDYVFTAAIILSIALVLIAAFKYMTASGDPEKLKSAHKTLMYVAVGLAVAILSRTIPILVGNFIGYGGPLNPCTGASAPPTGPAPHG
jgi:hypothetical protein